MRIKFKYGLIASVTCALAIFLGSCMSSAPSQLQLQFTTLMYEGTPPEFNYVAANAAEEQPLLVRKPELARELALYAFLKGTIYYTEGTYPSTSGAPPYDIITGGSTLDENIDLLPNKGNKYADHPRLLWNLDAGRPAVSEDNCGDGNNGTDLCSDAAGSGQFLSTTWDALWDEFGPEFYPGDKFSPINQELGVLLLFGKTGGYKALMSGVSVDTTGRVVVDVEAFTQAVHLSCGEWASFPCENGASAYPPQRAHAIEDMWANFNKVLLEKQATLIPVSASAPPEEKLIVPPTPTNPEDYFPEELKQPAVDGEIIKGAEDSYPITDIRRWREVGEVGNSVAYMHRGWDVGTPVGVKLFAPVPGNNECILDVGGNGLYSTFTPDNIPGTYFISKHLIECEDGHYSPDDPGVPVFGKTGGEAGEITAGFSTGPHLHLERWSLIDGEYVSVDYAKGWIEAFLTGQLPKA